MNEGSVDLVHKMGAMVPGLKKKGQHVKVLQGKPEEGMKKEVIRRKLD